MPDPKAREHPRSVIGSLRAYWPLVVPCVLAQVALGVFAARSYFAQHNTLAANGNWVSTKTTLARGLNGSYSFVTGLQALAGEKLDLSAWHGFQEVIHRREIEAPRRIEFDFELSPGADLAVLFNRDPEAGASGVRLSATERRSSCYFVANADGEFLSRQPLRRATFASDVEHRVRILLRADELDVEVDGEPVGTFSFARRRPAIVRFPGQGRERRHRQDYGLPVIDSNQRLLDLDDSGFLWWDKVHFTNYGHRVMARLMAEELRAIGLPAPAAPPGLNAPAGATEPPTATGPPTTSGPAAARAPDVPAPPPPASLTGTWDARVADGYGERYTLRFQIDDDDGALGGRFEVVDRGAGGTLSGTRGDGPVRLELAWAEPCNDVVWTLFARRQGPRLVGGFAGAMCTGEMAAGWVVATPG